jgi:hypothetical protein
MPDDTDRLPVLITLAFLLVLLLGASHAAAYQYTFQDADDLDDWEFDPENGGGSIARGQDSYSDTYFIRVGYSTVVCESSGYARHEISYPTNYWAVTVRGHTASSNWRGYKIKLWDSGGNYIAAYCSDEFSAGDRIEFVRSGSTLYIYRNGVYFTATNIGTTLPYYVGFGTRVCGSGTMYSYYDDIVIGTNEEHDVVSCPPSDWWIAKDFYDPGFSGLYSDYDTQVYADTMHIRYANDDGAANIIIEHIESGEVVCQTAVSSYAGIITIDLSDVFFDSGAPYGQYRVYSEGTDAYDTVTYSGITTSGTSVEWDETDYVDGDTGTILYSISETYWMTDDYTYKLVLEDTDFTDLQTWSIITRPVSAEKEVSISTSLFPTSGYYYACLYAVDKSSGEEIMMAYDYAYMYLAGSGEVIVEGETYDATTGNLLGSCVVTATQGGDPHSDTSDASTAFYQIVGLVTDASIGVNATKDSYVGYPVYFTPYAEGHYEVDVPLVPSGGASPGEWQEVDGGQLTQINHNNATTSYYNLTEDGTAIGGLCYLAPYWSLGDGCTVKINNATWSNTTTSGDGGWYQINNIPAGGNYYFTCSKSGYQTVNESITITADSFNRQDVFLDGDFTLTINIKNLATGTTISGDNEVLVELDSGESTTTTTGTCTFEDLDYGYYTITGECIGFYAGTAYAVVDGDVTENLYLQAESEGGPGYGIAYAPKSVRFTVQNIWGKKIQDCCVNCTGYETTAGPWEWLYTLFGVDCNETPIATEEMGGYTDYKGDINFLMLEPVKYNCSFVKAGEINKTIEIYPKDDYYLILSEDYGNASWFEGGMDINQAVNITVITNEINSTHAYINLTYTDSTGGTTGGTCYLNQTNTTPGGDEINLDSCALSSDCTGSFVVEGYAGESYILQFEPTHSTWDFTRTFTVTFPEEKVNPLGLSDTELVLMASFFVLFAGALFSAISAPSAPLVMSFVGWICYAMHWFDAVALPAFAGLVLGSVMSVAYLMAVGSKKERWT